MPDPAVTCAIYTNKEIRLNIKAKNIKYHQDDRRRRGAVSRHLVTSRAGSATRNGMNVKVIYSSTVSVRDRSRC